MPLQLQRHLFTVDDYYDMARTGILREDDRVELIEGEIVDMTPIGIQHIGCVNGLLDLFLTLQVNKRVVISIQNPVRLSDRTEPEPDFALLKPRSDFYRTKHPSPSDVLLIVEVADTSIDYDRETKIPLYSKHGILEVWIVDIIQKTIEVYNYPTQEGYQHIQTHASGATLSPTAFPDLVLNACDILGE